jgi:xyloglucan-specific exo-beta-1,4-glucanase
MRSHCTNSRTVTWHNHPLLCLITAMALGCGRNGSSSEGGDAASSDGSGGKDTHSAGASTSDGGSAGEPSVAGGPSSSHGNGEDSDSAGASGSDEPGAGGSNAAGGPSSRGGSGDTGGSAATGGSQTSGGRTGTGGSAGGPSNNTGATDGWGNVRFDGGGFVDGIVASTRVKGLFYARTDVGGAYRYNRDRRVWIPLLDWISQDDVGLYGVESLALDPNNPGRLYLLAGTSYFSEGKTAILRSEDYGATFETVDVSALWRAHGNGMGRQTGEKLAVDPNNSDIVFCGSRAAGLFKSSDAGKSWVNVSTIGAESGADLANANGIGFVLFDPSSNLTGAGATSTLYMGVSSATQSLYVSKDGGASWETISGGPSGQMPNRAVLSSGSLYVTYSNSLGPFNLSTGSFYRYTVASGTWTELTPKTDDGTARMGNGGQGYAHGFGGVSVDAADPDHIMLTTLGYYGGQTRFADGGENWGDRIYVTNDGGSTWTTGFSKMDPSVPANANASTNGNSWISGNAIHWAGDVAFDPFDSEQAWVVSGNGVFHTNNLGAAMPVWSFDSQGIEETVPLDIVSVPGGPLVTAIGDYDGSSYQDIAQSYPRHQPPIGTTQSLGYAPLTGAFLRAGHVTDYSTGTGIESDVMYYSEDDGATWTKLPTPKGQQGLVVLSADGKVLLHRPENSSTVYRSTDQGRTWTTVTGLDGQAQYARIVCDPVNADLFYVLDQQGKLLKSTDQGASFVVVGSVQNDAEGLWQSSNGLIRTVPGREGHLWAPLDQAQSWAPNGRFSTNGLAFSADGGASWTRFPSVYSAHAVGIGKAADGASYETLYIWGVAGESTNPLGIYYSTDKGASWKRMNDDQHQYGGPGNGAFVQGDMNVFGRVYMSTVGRGLIYGNVQAP